LGDNYLLTVLAALADRDGAIPDIFKTTKYNHEGIFAVQVYVKGRLENVTVDDLFPIYNNQPAFAKPTSDGAWWLPLLEKVYAKVNVNYEQISSGKHVEAARFFTGAPSREFSTNFQTLDELWNTLSLNLHSNNMLTAACFVEQHNLQT